jgi:hypothetical protein
MDIIIERLGPQNTTFPMRSGSTCCSLQDHTVQYATTNLESQAEAASVSVDCAELDQIKHLGGCSVNVLSAKSGRATSHVEINHSQRDPVSNAVAAAATTTTRNVTVKILLGPEVGDLTGGKAGISDSNALAPASVPITSAVDISSVDSDDDPSTSCRRCPQCCTLKGSTSRAGQDRFQQLLSQRRTEVSEHIGGRTKDSLLGRSDVLGNAAKTSTSTVSSESFIAFESGQGGFNEHSTIEKVYIGCGGGSYSKNGSGSTLHASCSTPQALQTPPLQSSSQVIATSKT